uniref:Pro-thyrotropin-releasing hormone n=1 Tax=Crocodylus porosus TaxID=8502 RepID=A0A7M4F317_CROPO
PAMTPVQLLLLLSLTLSGICLNLGQLTLEGGENSERSHLDDILQRAESILLRSILKKVEEEEELNKDASEPDSLSKRQHPGKRFFNELEKRQHPGKREDGEEALYGDIQKRQHPGKREEDDDLDRYLELQKRQHPGKSTQQHPGKRYLVYAKRQHPGKRGWEDELDLGEQDLEKRQHPGKRFSDSESPDYAAPCDLQDDINCSKGSLLLELLDNVNKGREEEKRQHPGRRFAWESEAEAEE